MVKLQKKDSNAWLFLIGTAVVIFIFGVWVGYELALPEGDLCTLCRCYC